MKINPILQKDIKTKLRGWRSVILICSYVTLLIFILLIYFVGNDLIYSYTMPSFNPRVAIGGYNLLITFQFALLYLAVPAITATSISSERERQTLDLMLVTKTPAREIIAGKILVSIAHILLLLIASMPVVGVVFFFGGIGFPDLLKLIFFYILTSLFVASSGVFFSTIFKRNIVSIITTYIFLGLMTFGPFLGFFAYSLLNQMTFSPTYRSIALSLFPSPVFGFLSFYFSGTSHYDIFGSYYGHGLFSSIAYEFEVLIASETGLLRYMQPWIVNGIFSVLFSLLLILLSSAALNPVRRKK
jgi:ABC-2 type transport system permease protein